MTHEHIDVLIIGAGLSGIAAAYYIQEQCPQKTYAVFEARDNMGGTWDLFNYPGIRSDSDMYTLGYTFYPWHNPKAIADGTAIFDYINETAQHFNITDKIRFQHRVSSVSWSSDDVQWTVIVETGYGEKVTVTTSYLYLCTGYYNYEQGHSPSFDGSDDFQGRIIHPQFWDENLDYSGKRVVVIGSGATAVTLVPTIAEQAQHVTMLQRSPSYIASLPSYDALASFTNRILPKRSAYLVTRWRLILMGLFQYYLARWQPNNIKNYLMKEAQQALGDDYDVETHFNPRYNPWDQRLCLIPDGDLFDAINAGKADIVTDTITKFTKTGIQLDSGQHIDADIIVTATGLKIQLNKFDELLIDGKEIDLANHMSYKGAMISDIPNMSFSIGYTNASWTLKCELISRFTCRIINHMDENNYKQVVARHKNDNSDQLPIIDFSSGYIQRAIHEMPSQGSKRPWKLYQNFIMDKLSMQYGRLDDGVLDYK